MKKIDKIVLQYYIIWLMHIYKSYIHLSIGNTMALKESSRRCVPSKCHSLHLLWGELIKIARSAETIGMDGKCNYYLSLSLAGDMIISLPHECHVYTHAPVHGTAVQAQVHTVGQR